MQAGASVGRFVAVVGPSGVGKDSVMDALCQTVHGMQRCRRIITRAPEAGGEDYEAVNENVFKNLAAAGAFALWWDAHGLSYGIPASVHDMLASGHDVVANLSRRKLVEARQIFDPFMVLSISATPQVLARRLEARGREGAADRQARLGRAAPPLPDGLPVVEIDNSGALDDAVRQAVAALAPPQLAKA
jgi:ribose 1,5-bisphosphokinase